MASYQNLVGGWEQLESLGEGGQSEVFLVRSPKRVQERNDGLQKIISSNPWAIGSQEGQQRLTADFANSLWNFARSDTPAELGALKKFKIPSGERDVEEALGRLRNEISILNQRKPGLVKLLDANEQDRWIVTGYIKNGSLDKHPGKYRGDAKRSLKAFRSLVETVATLHKENIVHRDIKPANVFLDDEDSKLVLGDFGIVFFPNQSDRLTLTNERVGPRDYMPQWADLGERLENVQPNFDVYMLGKLLWCMVTGRLKLPREYHLEPPHNVCVLFPKDPNMEVINEILEKCVVEKPQNCIPSAIKLLEFIDEILTDVEHGLPRLDSAGKLTLPCRICGRGFYQEHYPEGHYNLPGFDSSHRPTHPAFLRVFVCNVCTHYELFAPGNPEEAARRKWVPWRPN